jgi:kanamycin kinase
VLVAFEGPSGGEFIKWAPHHDELDLKSESTRLRWAASYIRVPEVIDSGADDSGTWLRTRALPGRSAVDPRWLAEPRTVARAIGKGLRRMHDALPVAECPFSWDLKSRFSRIPSPPIAG